MGSHHWRMKTVVSLKEADIKRAIDDFLQYGQNQGKWVFMRLNAGEFIEARGETRRRIKGCPVGTADFEVIKDPQSVNIFVRPFAFQVTRAIFIEVKSLKGKQSKEQIAFQAMVEAQGAEYHIVRSVEELEAIL